MDVAEILDQLTHAEGLPRAALQAASAQRIEMVPVFVREIDSYLALDSADRAKPTPLFFIFHLLGEWRERTAYRPLAHLLRCPGPEVDAILGDAITSTTHRVMAAVFDGDPQPLYEIILDPNAEQFARSRMCEALAMLVLRGELDRALAGRFLRDAFMELQPQAECSVWHGWQSAIAMLGLSKLEILVKRAFDRGFIDPHWLGFSISSRISNGRSNDRANRAIRKTTNSRSLATPLRSYRTGIALATTILPIGSDASNRPKLNLPKANPIAIRSEGSVETILVPVAAARSSRIAAWVDEVALRGMSAPASIGRSA
jgi:hypothetical protein